ncbi:PTS sugar transporter subunit IIA [Rhodohalobacter halophilus]|uniref:PTS sugar transporter subunit IIA n=1 Tax=Rhodohalobacter halophilus TaxID=1812810 RepID=UPI00083F9B3A|nr:PTS sugar transporter subunit IIA [Rhodohalobacter halophilus]
MNIYSLLDKSTILANLDVSSKKELLDEMIEVLSGRVSSEQLEDIRTAVFEREEIMSTGVGKSLAIPHGKVKSIDENLASFAKLKHPIEYNSIDGEPVQMVFLLVGPESKHTVHIKLLSRISRLMNSVSFRELLNDCDNPEDIYEAFLQEEQRYFAT